MLDKSDKEKLEAIAESANRYNLTTLLDQVCYYADPEENRRNLMVCYFNIAEHISYTGEGAGQETGQETGAALTNLRGLIKALDAMTGDTPAELKVSPSDKPGTIETLNNFAEELREAKQKLKEERHRAATWYDIYQHLWMIVAPVMDPEQKEKHKEFKNRLFESLKK